MRPTMMRWAMAAFVLGLLATTRAEAGVMLTVQASPGVDLGNIRVGDVFTLDTHLSSDDPGEYYQGASSYGAGSGSKINGSTSTPNPDRFTLPLINNPIYFTQTIRAVSAGADYYYASASIVTNRGRYDLTSGRLNITVQPAAVATPEPATLGSLALAAVGTGLVARRRCRRRMA